jgi:hypothetical protein
LLFALPLALLFALGFDISPATDSLALAFDLGFARGGLEGNDDEALGCTVRFHMVCLGLVFANSNLSRQWLPVDHTNQTPIKREDKTQVLSLCGTRSLRTCELSTPAYTLFLHHESGKTVFNVMLAL